MTKKEYAALFNSKPLTTVRTVLRPLNSLEPGEYFNHTLLMCNSLEDELKKVYLDGCKEQLESETMLTFDIRLADTGVYIGYFTMKFPNEEPEIGIDLLEEYQRQGYGYEVCRAAVDYLFENTGIRYISYVCFRNNTASRGLAAKLGAVKVREKVTFAQLSDPGNPAYDPKAAGFDLLVHEIRRP